MVRPSATVDLKGNDAHLKRALAMGEKRVKSYARNVGNALKSVAKMAAVAIPAAGLAIGIKSLNLAREQIQAEKKLEAVIRATGEAAGFSAEQLKKMAGDLQKVTNFGDEVTISAMAVLATFKEIKGDQFREAIKSAQDMSSVLGTDLQGSVLQLGKALNDPIKGITALSRAGVSFTQEQKDLIKALQESGEIMGAQQVILAELKGEFGGAAEEMADPITQAFNNLGDAGERLGLILLPVFTDLAIAMSEALEGAEAIELQYLKIVNALDKFDRATSIVDRPELDRDIDQREARIAEIKFGATTRAPELDPEMLRRLKAFEDANEGRAPETTPELLDFEAELEATRRKGAQAAANLAKEEYAAEKAAKAKEKADAKLQEGVVEFRRRLTTELEDGGVDKSADQKRLDELKGIGGGEREEIQSRIDQLAERKKKQELEQEGKNLEEEGKNLEESLKTPFESFQDELDRFGRLFQGGAIDEETRDRAIDRAVHQVAPGLGDPEEENRGFQARFEGISAAYNRISAAAASRPAEDRAAKAAERAAVANEAAAVKAGEIAKQGQIQNGILGEIRDKLPPPAVAG